MNRLALITAAMAFATAAGFAGTAFADPYADDAVSVTRVTPGQASPSNGSVALSTDADDADDGSNATDAPDWAGSGSDFSKITVLGFDENNTDATGDDSGGNVVLDFTDNVCLDLAGADIKLYDAFGDQSLVGNESAMIEVSNSGNAGLTDIGDVVPGGGEAGYELDVSGAVPYFNRVRVTAIDWAGQTDAAGFDLDAVECLASLDKADIVKTHTGVTDIDVGLGVLQTGFSFTIEITNNTGVAGGLSGLTFFDAVPGEFDLDGPPALSGNCTVVTDNPKGAKKKGLSKLEPEFIIIDAGGLDDGASCTIEVFVKTDGKTFPNGRSPAFTPTSCLAVPGTIVLNDGVKVFDSLMNLLLQGDDTLTLDCNQFTG